MISILVVQRKYASFKLKDLNDYYGDWDNNDQF